MNRQSECSSVYSDTSRPSYPDRSLSSFGLVTFTLRSHLDVGCIQGLATALCGWGGKSYFCLY